MTTNIMTWTATQGESETSIPQASSPPPSLEKSQKNDEKTGVERVLALQKCSYETHWRFHSDTALRCSLVVKVNECGVACTGLSVLQFGDHSKDPRAHFASRYRLTMQSALRSSHHEVKANAERNKNATRTQQERGKERSK